MTFRQMFGMDEMELVSQYRAPEICRPIQTEWFFSIDEQKVFEWYDKHARTDERFLTYEPEAPSHDEARKWFEKHQNPGEFARTTNKVLLMRFLHTLQPYKTFCQSKAFHVGLNCYMTRPGSVSIPLHEDGHHVLAVQSHGEKIWYFWPPGDTLPENHETWHLNPSQTTPWATKLVKAGEALFVPKGWRHFAHAKNGTSIHFSLGLTPRHKQLRR